MRKLQQLLSRLFFRFFGFVLCFFLLPVQLLSDFVLLLVILSPPYYNEDRHGRGKRDGDPRENEKEGRHENGDFSAKPGFCLR